MKKFDFVKALPVWEKDKDKEKNYNLAFRAVIDRAQSAAVSVSAANTYQLFVNGEMVSHGPARAGHGNFRVDRIDISDCLTNDKNVVVIYATSYYIMNFYLPKQPGFLCAEIVCDGSVVAATGVCGFEAKYHDARLRFVDRQCYQRTFAEIYRLGSNYKDFEVSPDCEFDKVELVPVGDRKFIERGVPYPCYDEYPAKKVIARGGFEFIEKLTEPYNNRWLNPDPVYVECFTRDEAEYIVIDEIDKCKCDAPTSADVAADGIVLSPHEYAIFDIGREKTGFVLIDVECERNTELILSFDEILTDGDVSTRRNGQSNGWVWFLADGAYKHINNEPNSMRYIKVANNSDGKTKINRIAIKEYAFNYKSNGLGSNNHKLNAIFDAAIESFRQNTLDIYMDCPSRERAGWLCDSYFTSQVEHYFTGKSLVERNFLENFIIAEGFTDLPDYMLPECYPANAMGGGYIPNWAMWYVLELEQYYKRTGDRELVDMAKDKLMKLYNYFESKRNSDGLIENLESWVFIEWSKANDFVQDVNYPSNMIYTKMLRVLGALYGGDFAKEADEISETIRTQSYFDGFFHDHAVRENGKLVVKEADITETCQYYAFFTGVATPETHSELWNILLNDFGPDRQEKGLWNEIYPSNAFIGNYLRLCLLEREGETQKLLDNIEGYFYYMAERTGTLWENMQTNGSCNHGFTSLVAVWLDRYAK